MRISLSMSKVIALAVVLVVTSGFARAESVVKGKVTFKGGREALKGDDVRKEIPTSADPNCAAKIGGYRAIVQKAADGAGLQNVIVYIKNAPKLTAPPTEKVTLDQKGCEYVPHVLTLAVGQTLEIKNSDPTTHNIHSLSEKNEQFNFSQPKPGMVKDITFKTPEIFRIKCDVHTWMGSYVGVFDHALHTVTAKEGTFELKGVPDGEHEVVFWHETFGEKTGKVTVKGAEATVDMEFSY